MSAPEWPTDELDREDYKGEYTQWKETIVIALDCGPHMHTLASKEDAPNQTWFTYAVNLIRQIIRVRTIQSELDKIAVLLYNTRVSKNKNDFPSVYVWQDMQVPGVDQLQQLDEELDDPSYVDTEIGVGEGSKADALHKALWTANELLREERGHRVKRAVWIMSNDQRPQGKEIELQGPEEDAARAVVERARNMVESEMSISLLALCSKLTDFDMSFWAHVIMPEDDWTGKAAHELPLPDDATSVESVVRKRAYKQRTLTTIGWFLSDKYQLDISLYALLLPATGPKKVGVHVTTGKAVRTVTSKVHPVIGDEVKEVAYRFPKNPPPAERYPSVILNEDEHSMLKRVQTKGLHLIGFRPITDLQPWHQIRSSYFVYPNEKYRPGSTAAFVALYKQLGRKRRMAVCSLVCSNNIEPRLVVMIPQVECIDVETDAQEQPPGFAMVFLPFADDIRAPEAEPGFVGVDSGTHRAPPEAVDAACDMIQQLRISPLDASMLTEIPNPTLQQLYKVLEVQAMHGDLGVADIANDRVDDGTLPERILSRERWIAARPSIEAFRAIVYGADHEGPDPPKPAKPAGTRVRATPQKRKADVQALGEERLAELRGMGMETLLKLKANELEELCVQLGLAKSGNKQEKAQRIHRALVGDDA